MIGFIHFKNTFLLLFLLIISCGGGNKKEKEQSTINEKPVEVIDKDNQNKGRKIIVGANRTDLYLPLLKGKKVAVVANQTSVIFKPDSTYIHLIDSLRNLEIDIVKVFSPEHGFRGMADAGEEVADGKDKKTGLSIFSLHGKHKKPTKNQLEDVDVLIFDIQDVGVRFYTYISTLHYVMEACAENNVPVIIMDRPNPNGSYVDGPTMEPQHTSFLGMHTIPLVHGMTIGEYAKMINGEKWLADSLQCEIEIIPLKNYTHNMTYSLPIRPSPNLPNDHSIKLYPSLGLFEGTNINAGRGTEFQFQMYGAPFLDSIAFSHHYIPKSNFGAKYPKHKDKISHGKDLRKVTPKKEVTLKWLINAYTNSTDKSLFFKTESFTKHAGTKKLQKQIETGMSEAEIKKTWQAGISKFKETRNKYLIYK